MCVCVYIFMLLKIRLFHMKCKICCLFDVFMSSWIWREFLNTEGQERWSADISDKDRQMHLKKMWCNSFLSIWIMRTVNSSLCFFSDICASIRIDTVHLNHTVCCKDNTSGFFHTKLKVRLWHGGLVHGVWEGFTSWCSGFEEPEEQSHYCTQPQSWSLFL